MSRAVTAIAAGTVMLGMLGSTASADTPTAPGAYMVDGQPDVTALRDLAADFASQCAASDVVCDPAVGTSANAMQGAIACAQAMASDTGVPPDTMASMKKMSLDCTGVVRLMVALAEFAVTVANQCASEDVALCRTVFEAARVGMDRVRGCLSAVVPRDVRLQTTGTDPDCAAAIGMLWRQAEGVIAMLTGCIYGSENLCEQAREHAEFARDGLTGCVGQVLWVAPEEVQPIVPGGGPLPCYSILDQVLVSTNGLLGVFPTLPTQITPMGAPEDCTITLAPPLPFVSLSDPTKAADYNVEPFLPSCDEPEWPHTLTDAETPAVDAGIAPHCEPKDEYVVDKTKADGKKYSFHRILGNRNAPNPVTWTVEETVTDELGAKITAGASGEVNIWVKKVNVHAQIEGSASRTWTHNIKIEQKVPMGREGHVASIAFTKVAEGRRVITYDNCKVKTLFRRVRVPYKDYWDYWEEPYSGGE